jgi:hypothetical protein
MSFWGGLVKGEPANREKWRKNGEIAVVGEAGQDF